MAKCRVSIRSPVGADNYMYGSSTSNYLQWDASENNLIFKGAAGMSFGTLSSESQTGITLSSTNNSVFDVFADDGNATLGNAVYTTVRGRTMLFKDATGISLFSVRGQIKAANGVDFGPGVYAGVQGYMELVGDTSVQSGAKWWGVDSSFDVPSGKTLTVDSGGIAAGFHAELTGSGTASSSGTLAGLYIDEQISSGKWDYGIYIVGAAVDQGIMVGSFSSSTAGSGVALDATHSYAMGVFADDNGAAIGSGTLMRAIRARTLLTYTGGNREQEVASVIGQVNSVGGTNRHNMCGVMGSYELSGSSALTVDGQAFATDPWIQAAIIGRVGVGTSKTTINSNGRLSALAAMSNTASFTANNGVYAGLYIGKWNGTTDFGYGVYQDDAVGRSWYSNTTLAGSSALNNAEFAITDATTNSSGYTRGIYVNATVSGDKTSSGEFNGIGVDATVSGNTPYLYGYTYWSQDSGDPTIGYACPFSIYQDDLGSNLTAWSGIDIGFAFSNAPDTGVGIKFRNHSSTTNLDAVFLLQTNNNEPMATYLLDFQGNVTDPIAADTSAVPGNATYKIKCRYHETDFYLIGVADF